MPSRTACGWLAVAFLCGCVSTLDDARGAGATTGGGGSSSGSSSASTSQAATGGAAGAAPTTGGGGSECRFACPVDGGGGTFGPPPTSDASDGARAGGANDASTDAPSPGAACTPDLRLCDDFESYADGMVPGGKWQTLKPPSNGASLVVDSTKAYSGTKAIHVKVAFTGGGTVDIATKAGDPAFAAPTDTMFARFMMFQGTFTVPGELHARILRLGNMNAPSGSNGTGYSFALHSYPTPVALQVESMNDLYVGTRVMPVLGQWVCWEMQFGPGVVGWWKDGTKVNSPTPGGWPTVMQQMLEVGFDTFTPVTTEFWIDDVAVDTKRIGCPPPK
jgi:hypothetical protein